MPDLWLDTAERIAGPHAAGNPMDKTGGHFCTHHITVTAKGSYVGARRVLLGEGFEPTLVVDPTLGKIGQFFPADRGGYALMHPSGDPTTNTEGDVHIQVEWVWPNMADDITLAPHFDDCWRAVVGFARANGVPDNWPFGFHSTSRDLGLWRKSGHRGHVNAPNNSHVDNLPAAKVPAFPSNTHPITVEHRGVVDEAISFLRARSNPLVGVDRARLVELVAAANHALSVK